MKKIIFILFFTLSFSMSTHSFELIWGIVKFAPFSVIKDGEISGSTVIKVKSALDALNLEYITKAIPQRYYYQKMASNEINFGVAPINAKVVAGNVYFSKQPFQTIQLKIFTLKSTNDLPHSLGDVMKLGSIVLIRGYDYGGLKKIISSTKLKIVTVRNHKAAIKKLQSGDALYVLDYANPFAGVAKKMGVENKFQSSEIKKIDLYFIANKDYPNAQQLLEIISKKYHEMYNTK